MITSSIVTYNHRLPDIEPALKSLLASSVSSIVIIDHSEDKSVLRHDLTEYMAQNDRIVFVEHKNLGYGSGHNVALRMASDADADYHIVVNPDVWFDPSIVSTIEAYMNANQEVGQVMPKVLYPDGSVQRLCKLLPTPWDMFGRLCLPHLIAPRNHTYELSHSNYNRLMNVPYLSGCFMFFRMEAVRNAGYFDEHFFMYAEDIDMTRRIHRNYVTLFYPDVHIYHKFSRASRKSLRLFWVHFINIIMYFNKYGWLFDSERDAINKRTLEQLL